MKLIGSPEINKVIRKILSPTLRENGFSKVNTRNNWGWHDHCIWVLNIQAVGNYFSEVTGWTPSSLTVCGGIYFDFIPPLEKVKTDEKGNLLPKYHECPIQFLEFECTLDQTKYIKHLDNPAERKRTDIWWIEPDGSNVEQVITNITDVFLKKGLDLFKKYTDLEVAFRYIEEETTGYSGFHYAKYFAKFLNESDKFEKYNDLFIKEAKRIGEI